MRGKRRLHKRPDNYEIERCKIWLDFERSLVKPASLAFQPQNQWRLFPHMYPVCSVDQRPCKPLATFGQPCRTISEIC
jgi:hypothetical protein